MTQSDRLTPTTRPRMTPGPFSLGGAIENGPHHLLARLTVTEKVACPPDGRTLVVATLPVNGV